MDAANRIMVVGVGTLVVVPFLFSPENLFILSKYATMVLITNAAYFYVESLRATARDRQDHQPL